MEFNLKEISTHRAELMGLSAIAILFCHAPGNNVFMPSILSIVLSIGGYGVDMFLFLSGMGLWYSLHKIDNQHGKLTNWYSKRYKRLLIPYLIISVIYYTLFCVMQDKSLLNLPYYVSTISFWTEHQGQWFVDALIPIYAFAPILYRVLQRTSNHWSVALAGCLLCFVISAMPNNDPEPLKSVWGNIQYVVCRIPGFILGMWLAPYIMKGKALKNPLLYVCISAVLFMVSKVSHFEGACFMIAPLLMLFMIIIRFGGKVLYSIIAFMGAISLESYLLNVTLPFFIVRRLNWTIGEVNLGFGNYLPYLSVVVLGTILAYLINKLSNRIINARKYQ